MKFKYEKNSITFFPTLEEETKMNEVYDLLIKMTNIVEKYSEGDENKICFHEYDSTTSLKEFNEMLKTLYIISDPIVNHRFFVDWPIETHPVIEGDV